MTALPMPADQRPAGACTFRVYRPEDAEDRAAVTSLYAAYLREGFALTGEAPLGMAVALDLTTVLACWEGAVIGFASVHTGHWEVEVLYVAPSFRRRGVARALLVYADQWARMHDSGRDGIQARVPVSAAAVPLLASLRIPEAPHSPALLAEFLDARATELHDVAAACECQDPPPASCTACYDRWAQEQAVQHVQAHLDDIDARVRFLTRHP
ncbi:GNAT family N-acetyltransferase [Streptomyces virginiae]|uniref:GNAT family N-acetyltransferase n=1 Tax=Streptomyces virginiae TaxID=1961 RepID=UPI00324F7B4F